MKHFQAAAPIAALLLLGACAGGSQAPQLTKSGLNPEKFKSVYRGDSTALYTLVNNSGMEACITNFGGRVVSLSVPDRDGNLTDVVLGFDSIQAYYPENNLSDFGASIGRYANRIDHGKFKIDDNEYQLPLNNGTHSLHGGGELGTLGWQYRVFSADQPNDSTIVLTLQSPDGDNGYPGNVTATVTYTLRSDNALDIDYTATTDMPTIINMTNHSYFNLNGNPDQVMTDNEIMINAAQITPVDSTFMTDGTFMAVEETPFDLNTLTPISKGITDFSNEQMKNGNGYDHNFVLNTNGDASAVAAQLYSPSTGILLEVLTDEPGVQFYSGNFLDGSATGKGGKVYNQHSGMCLETQHYPDSPNKPEWPSVRLNPGDTYKSHCTYRFSVK